MKSSCKIKENYPFELSNGKNLLENYKNDLFKEDSLQLSGRFASESLLKRSTLVVQSRLLFQTQNYPSWHREDSKKIGLIVNKDFMMKFDNKHSSKEPEFFEIKNVEFYQENNSIRFITNENEEWVQMNQKTGKGITIKNEIIRINKKLNLRALGIRGFFSFALEGPESTLSVILRGGSKLSNEEVILVQFVKEGNEFNQRLFVLIGRLNENKTDFVYLKKCEIPLIEQKNNFLIQDKLDITCTIVDYGTDKIQLRVEVLDKSNKPLRLKYSELFIPYFEDFFLYVIGIGKAITLKKIVIEFFDRKEWENDSIVDFPFAKCQCNIF